jgi:hypothetical protein
MQNSITLNMLVSAADSGFSLDDLVQALAHVSQEKGLPGIVACVLRLVDGMLGLRHMKAEGWPGPACCDNPRYESMGLQERRIRTSIGDVRFSWRRYRCAQCGRTRVPLREFLGLERHQSHTGELEQMVVEVVTDQSYRRSCSHLDVIGGIPVPKSTAHRWLLESPCDDIDPAEEKLATVMADGTGYKRRPDPLRGLDNRGQVRMAVGISPQGRVQALGAWSGESWEQIAQQLGKGLEEGQKLAGMLVSDGEPGLREALSPLTDEQQRCQWHMTHELDSPMHDDGAPKRERRAMQKEMATLLRIELPAEDAELVRPEDRQVVQKAMESAEQGLHAFYWKLVERGYRRAATYVSEAKDRLFSYVRFWLKHGVVNPRVSSFIERLMREIARRLKRIGFGWRAENAAKMTRLILKRITDPGQWAAYWKKRLRLDGNVVFAFLGVTAAPQTLGR